MQKGAVSADASTEVDKAVEKEEGAPALLLIPSLLPACFQTSQSVHEKGYFWSDHLIPVAAFPHHQLSVYGSLNSTLRGCGGAWLTPC